MAPTHPEMNIEQLTTIKRDTWKELRRWGYAVMMFAPVFLETSMHGSMRDKVIIGTMTALGLDGIFKQGSDLAMINLELEQRQPSPTVTLE